MVGFVDFMSLLLIAIVVTGMAFFGIAFLGAAVIALLEAIANETRE